MFADYDWCVDEQIQSNDIIASNLDDIGDIFNDKDEFNFRNNLTSCNVCNGKIIRDKNIYICIECGLELSNITLDTEDNYNTALSNDGNVSKNGYVTLKLIGKGSYRYNKNMLRACADYAKFRKMNILKGMKNLLIHSDDQHIPKYVLNQANEMFAKVKEAGTVLRTHGHRGVISACIYYACYENNISKTPAELAKLLSIDEKFHSKGIRILQSLNEKNYIKLPKHINTINDFVEKNMAIVDIPYVSKNKIKYRDFVIEIINKAEKSKLHILNDCKNTTKATGAIYLLITRVPELHNVKEKLDTEWKISQTTYKKYYKMLITYYKLFKKIFKHYKIPMPKEWKD